ncbi:MAG: endolytic transglycosylase MltG [Saezia sp.]
MAKEKLPKKKSWLAKLLISLFLLLVVATGTLVGAGWKWINTPLSMRTEKIEMEVERGASVRTVVNNLVKVGVDVNPDLLYQYFRWSGQSQHIRAGSYEFQSGDSPYMVLQRLVEGSQITRSIILLEGWSFAQFRQQLNASPDMKHDTLNMSDEEVMTALGRAGEHPEGRFFPDTYIFNKNSSDLDILRRSMQHMDKFLEEVWAQRDEDLTIKTPYEALILASIIEKETGRDEDRFLVAGVFTNRLRQGIKLQTDPTVVYGVGDAYKGVIYQSHLDKDTPYNTYTRFGLPPTPIAMPSKKSLLAAVHPGKTKALFFVARGNGASHFSRTNADHEKAVSYYLRGGRRPPPPSLGIEE